MKDNIRISINQLADFALGTEAKKKRLIKQQKTPNKFLIPWYQLAKARIRKSIQENGELSHLLDGIENLKKREKGNKRQETDKQVSIEAMTRFINLKLPKILEKLDYEILKPPKQKSLKINGVRVIISPDVIFKAKLEGQTVIGAVKIRIAKSTFESKQQRIIAVTLMKYLEKEVATNGEIVIPELCLSLDLFGNGFVSAASSQYSTLNDLKLICNEVRDLWDAA